MADLAVDGPRWRRWSQLVAPLALNRASEAYGGPLMTTRLAYGTRIAPELPIAVRV